MSSTSYSHLTDEELVRHLYAQGGLNPLETELLLRLEGAVECQAEIEEILDKYEGQALQEEGEARVDVGWVPVEDYDG